MIGLDAWHYHELPQATGHDGEPGQMNHRHEGGMIRHDHAPRFGAYLGQFPRVRDPKKTLPSPPAAVPLPRRPDLIPSVSPIHEHLFLPTHEPTIRHSGLECHLYECRCGDKKFVPCVC